MNLCIRQRCFTYNQGPTMRDTENQHARIHIWLSETHHLLTVFVLLFIFTNEVASLYDCREVSDNLTIDCVYIREEGILCTWDWKNIAAVGFEGGHTATATLFLNSSDGIPSQICIDQDANTTCRFLNHFDESTMFFVTALVNNSRAEEVYHTCKGFTLLTTVRYEKPRNIRFYYSWDGRLETDVVWEFPSDYPTSQGVMKTWSFCKVRWSEDLGPWEERQVRSNNYMLIDNLRPLSTYNVQITCLGMYSRRENWSLNETFTTTARTGGIDHDPASDVTPTQSTVTWFRTVTVITKSPAREHTSEQSALRSSTRSKDLNHLPTTINALSNDVEVLATSNGSGAPLALGVIGAVILLSAVLIGGLIFTYRYRKHAKKDNISPPVEDDINVHVADISRWLSRDKLLENASYGNCTKNSKESVL